MLEYHDNEWGVPTHGERELFELLILEGQQAGLSWATILNKREAFRRAYGGFDPEAVAAYGEADVARIMQDAGVIRNLAKVRAAVANAQAYIRLREAGGSLDAFLWGYVGGKPVRNAWERFSDIPPSTPLSDRVSKDLAKLGFKFCGPKIVYALMQSAGVVNDHLVGCPRYGACG